MADRGLIEILATHADRLNAGADEEAECQARLPKYRDTLQPLLALAQKVKGALTLVEPDPVFCEDLRLSLLAAARQQSASRLSLQAEFLGLSASTELKVLGTKPQAEGSTESQRSVHLFRRHRKEILIGAAALGSVVSVAGIVAYWIHSRAAKTQRALPG